MGKVFDALSKSNKEAVIITEGPGPPEARPVVAPRPSAGDAPIDLGKPLYKQNHIDANLVVLNDPQSFEAEQFKILRTNLLFPVSGVPPKTILVTSAVPGEGKSFVSANLAISIAQNIEEHVLLMDCDIRLPCLHRRFGFDSVPGLSEYLSGKIPLSSVILKTQIAKLSLLPGGTPPHNPSELLSSESMAELVEEVKHRYADRYIIIDSPPPNYTAETAALARQIDGIVLVVNSGKTPRGLVEDLVNSLGKEKILGVVMNRFDFRGSRYYGYGKYGKYGSYGTYGIR
ncbi:MAG: polysaccharide biosynthesis tyrosine autokinase [Desulfobacterales bacterium]|jgi:exopolysaccharide/PEP-CTERM locus tyrosine autokinase|nr:polysaccharide biosynthesis tyrosine autokinase [Desulfobacterales bacterium]